MHAVENGRSTHTHPSKRQSRDLVIRAIRHHPRHVSHFFGRVPVMPSSMVRGVTTDALCAAAAFDVPGCLAVVRRDPATDDVVDLTDDACEPGRDVATRDRLPAGVLPRELNDARDELGRDDDDTDPPSLPRWPPARAPIARRAGRSILYEL